MLVEESSSWGFSVSWGVEASMHWGEEKRKSVSM